MERAGGKGLIPLVVPNEEAEDSKKKYIWYGGSPERRKIQEEMFRFFLQNKIYIQGFISNEKELAGTWMYHKKIIDICDLEKKESIVFAEKEYAGIPHEIFCKAYRLNPLLKGGQAVIWGAGRNGKAAYEILTNAGIDVMCFIDANKEMQGGLNGVPVYGLEMLGGLDNSVVLVEAYDEYFEMDKKVQEYCPHIRQKFYCDVYSMLILYREQGKILLNLDEDKWDLLKLHGKKVYIYGTGEDELEISCYLKLMDYHVAAYLSDNSDMKSGILGGYPIMPVADILYEDQYAVYVQGSETGKAKKYLKELGVCMDLDVVMIPRKALTIMDVNLGYTYFYEGYYPGISIYGQERKKNYRIAALGGSTTDGTWKIKSWPQFLYEQLGRKDVTVYNAGVSGYVSGQELIRLIRDILPLKPDMVIVYDGINDSGGNGVFPEEPFAFNYARTVYEFGARHIDEYLKKMDGKYMVNYGMRSCKGRFGNWLSNIESMHAICETRGIAFHSFMQPMFMSKGRYNESEQEKREKCEGDYCYMAGFRDLMKKYDIEASHPYIHDLSHIFDKVENVYFDVYHVYDKGNKIIAEEIYKYIAGETV